MLEEEQLQRLFQYAMALCQQREDALDVVQSSLESFLKTQNHSKVVVENPEAYLRTTIRNRVIDLYKSQNRWEAESYEEGSFYDISPFDLEGLEILQQELSRVWERIDLIDRDILYHWAVLGYSTDEASELLGLSRGTFLSRMHRLKKRIQAEQASIQHEYVKPENTKGESQ